MSARTSLIALVFVFVVGTNAVRGDVNAEPADPGRLEITVLDQGMSKPLIVEPTPDGRVFFIELHGKFKIWHPGDGRVTEAATFEVYDQQESGLLGLALDPNFERNQWVYI